MRDEKQPTVYIMTNKPKGVLYIGVTSQPVQRWLQHRMKMIKGFTEKYNCTRLAWFERWDTMEQAITREKQVKGWLREKKIVLIESLNPGWNDLYDEIANPSS
jgi:putative endonuclease